MLHYVVGPIHPPFLLHLQTLMTHLNIRPEGSLQGHSFTYRGNDPGTKLPYLGMWTGWSISVSCLCFKYRALGLLSIKPTQNQQTKTKICAHWLHLAAHTMARDVQCALIHFCNHVHKGRIYSTLLQLNIQHTDMTQGPKMGPVYSHGVIKI